MDSDNNMNWVDTLFESEIKIIAKMIKVRFSDLDNYAFTNDDPREEFMTVGCQLVSMYELKTALDWYKKAKKKLNTSEFE